MPEIYSAEVKEKQAQGEALGKEAKKKAQDLVMEILRRVGETPKKEAFGAYVVCPGKRFVNEQEDEEVVLLLRAHPITNVRWILGTLFLLVVPQIFLIVSELIGIPANIVFIGRLLIYLIALGYAFENFLRWYYSVLIITNERIVDVDFVNLLHRHIAYAALNHIEQPSLRAGGVLHSFFNYGDVDVATAAESSQVEIADVPFPDRVLRIISELSEELEKRRERGE